MLPEQALRLTRPTDGFLCPLSANKYKIDFKEFEIKDYDSGESLFHVKRDPEAALPTVPDDIDPAMEAAVRTVRYTFPRRSLGGRRFGPRSCSRSSRTERNFRMIERHYFKDELVVVRLQLWLLHPESVNRGGHLRHAGADQGARGGDPRVAVRDAMTASTTSGTRW